MKSGRHRDQSAAMSNRGAASESTKAHFFTETNVFSCLKSEKSCWIWAVYVSTRSPSNFLEKAMSFLPYYDGTMLLFSPPMRDKDTYALREMFQYSSLAEKPLDQWEIATHWRAFQIQDKSRHCDPHLDQTKFNGLLPLTIEGVLNWRTEKLVETWMIWPFD